MSKRSKELWLRREKFFGVTDGSLNPSVLWHALQWICLGLFKFLTSSIIASLLQFSASFLLAVSATVLAVLQSSTSTVTAFTPDAAFKRSQYNLSPSTSTAGADKSQVFTYSKSESDADEMRRRRFRGKIPFVNNLRKSVTAPPSFEEYMQTRQRQLKEEQDQE